ncbi:hypothetical protein [Actinoplanes sp. G11-F43]|uniref:hypothetical protein n=1 Tax=Actinoplanes sp. G11-F43 TaxID=3424130 RepID=UPI003D33D767
MRKINRPLVITVAVLLTAGLGAAGWRWATTEPVSGPHAAELAEDLEFGGPEGWTAVHDSSILPVSVVDAMADGERAEPERVPVTLGDKGYTIIWTTPAKRPDACTELSDWAASRGLAGIGEVAASCRQRIAMPDPVLGHFTRDQKGERTFYGVYGDHEGEAALFATLTYTAA